MPNGKEKLYPSYQEQFGWFYTEEAKAAVESGLRASKRVFQTKGKECALPVNVLRVLPWDLQNLYLQSMQLNTVNNDGFQAYYLKAQKLSSMHAERITTAEQLLGEWSEPTVCLAQFQQAVYDDLYARLPDYYEAIQALENLERYIDQKFAKPLMLLRDLEGDKAKRDDPRYLLFLYKNIPPEVLADRGVMGFDYFEKMTSQLDSIATVLAEAGEFNANDFNAINNQPKFDALGQVEESYAEAMKRDEQVLRVSALVIPILAFFVVLPLVALFYCLPRLIHREVVFRRDWQAIKRERDAAITEKNGQVIEKKKAAFKEGIQELIHTAVPRWRGEDIDALKAQSLSESKLPDDGDDCSVALSTPPLTPRARSRSGTPPSVTAHLSDLSFMRKPSQPFVRDRSCTHSLAR